MNRFYLPVFDTLVLTGTEAHHCRDVLRLKTGDEVEVFNGRGHAVRCQITNLNKDGVPLRALQHIETPPLSCRITLAQAIPKKNMDFIVQKATELGVATIAPVISERTVKRIATNPSRWHEIALESCKQCGNNWLPDLLPVQSICDFLATAGQFDLKLVASLQPGSQSLKSILAAARPRSVLILIGPEGDLTMAEYAAAEAAGCRPLSLGSLVLRADTAAVCALSILQYECQAPTGPGATRAAERQAR